MPRLQCTVINCARTPIWVSEEDPTDVLCERHSPDERWSEMRAEGVEIETMWEYRQELLDEPDFDPDPYDPDFD